MFHVHGHNWGEHAWVSATLVRWKQVYIYNIYTVLCTCTCVLHNSTIHGPKIHTCVSWACRKKWAESISLFRGLSFCVCIHVHPSLMLAPSMCCIHLVIYSYGLHPGYCWLEVGNSYVHDCACLKHILKIFYGQFYIHSMTNYNSSDTESIDIIYIRRPNPTFYTQVTKVRWRTGQPIVMPR